jgi:hypothetical protein
MVAILLDYNITGYADRLRSTFHSENWSELVAVEFLTFNDIALPFETSDRDVWRLVQDRRIILLTGNRNSEGRDSLGVTIKKENSPDSLPVLTVGRQDDLALKSYRIKCVARLVAIVLDLSNFRGVGRLFIP